YPKSPQLPRGYSNPAATPLVAPAVQAPASAPAPAPSATPAPRRTPTPTAPANDSNNPAGIRF
ncbi:MAG: NrdH-redoxin, partial [Burkholderiales bacterium]|nr:NrdH-redoxin [Burkholderiales bacterium]